MKLFCLLCALILGALPLSPRAAEIFGSYANGCVRGAVPLRPGEGFQVLIYGRDRNFGHPELIDYVEKLARRARENGLPDLLIGDLSLRYGGPFGKGSAHGSHQIGLDVDVSFDFAAPRRSAAELARPQDVYIVDSRQRPTAAFDERRVRLIYLASLDERVERIFVAPGIKRALCGIYRGADRSWLGKLRPWFEHRAHLHVRLKCPADSVNCVPQPAVPEGDGCGEELKSWFEPPSRSAPAAPRKKEKKIPPPQCRAVLQGR